MLQSLPEAASCGPALCLLYLSPMRLFWLLPSYSLHQIERDDSRGIVLRSGRHNAAAGRKILVSLTLAGILLIGAWFLLGHVPTLVVETLPLPALLLVLNALSHLWELRKRGRYHRFVTFSPSGIRLQRTHDSREEVIGRERISRLIVVRQNDECKVYVNEDEQPRFYLLLSPDQQERVLAAITRFFALHRAPDVPSGNRKVTELHRDAPPASRHRSVTPEKKLKFFRVDESGRRFTVTLTAAGGGSTGRYGSFVYTSDGHFHQMNTGTRVKLPIPVTRVADIQFKVVERLGSDANNVPNAVGGELYLLLKDKRIETLLYIDHRSTTDVAMATLTLRKQLATLKARLEKLARDLVEDTDP